MNTVKNIIMSKNKIQISSSNDLINVLPGGVSIEIDSYNNRIKSEIKAHIDFTLPTRTEIFDDSFGRSFN